MVLAAMTMIPAPPLMWLVVFVPHPAGLIVSMVLVLLLMVLTTTTIALMCPVMCLMSLMVLVAALLGLVFLMVLVTTTFVILINLMALIDVCWSQDCIS
jgi:asparagine N-glycosylation enzyme membrane subunit Stt3